MKKAFIITLLLTSAFNLVAQKGVTFKVENLSEPKIKIFPTKDYDTILKDLIKEEKDVPSETLQFPAPVPANIIAQSKVSGRLVSRGFHSFLEGMYAAYADHHPFTLSPDMIWLVINQGFAKHVNSNAEELRKLFVSFEGKKLLNVNTNTIKLDDPNSPWEEAFDDFDKQIGNYTGREVTNALTANFTTTTPITKIASQITMMNALMHYFEYRVTYAGCGIPQITLEGTTADWERVLNKTEALRKYKLDWWIDKLEPILKQFMAASKGKVNKNFWRGMFKQHSVKGGCGGKVNTIDGWIVKFYPYDKDGKKTNFKGIELGFGPVRMPGELVKVDLEYIDQSVSNKEVRTPLELYAGFVGLEQNTETYGLKPIIGWMIRKKDTAK